MDRVILEIDFRSMSTTRDLFWRFEPDAFFSRAPVLSKQDFAKLKGLQKKLAVGLEFKAAACAIAEKFCEKLEDILTGDLEQKMPNLTADLRVRRLMRSTIAAIDLSAAILSFLNQILYRSDQLYLNVAADERERLKSQLLYATWPPWPKNYIRQNRRGMDSLVGVWVRVPSPIASPARRWYTPLGMIAMRRAHGLRWVAIDPER